MSSIKKYCLILTKGFLIGIGVMIPGLSGGTMAILVDEFENLLSSVSDIFKSFGKTLRYLFPISIGIVIGVYTITSPLTYLRTSYLLFSNLLFCGISVLSTLLLSKKCISEMTIKRFIIYSALGTISASLISLSFNYQAMVFQSNAISLLIIGIPLSLALILPAISFSYMLLFFDLYDSLIIAIKEFDVKFLIPLFIGLTLGVFIFSKLLLYAIKRNKNETYAYVIGFMLLSLIDIIS